jgi:transposase
VNQAILGIDVSKDSLDVHLILTTGSEYGTFGNNDKGHHRLINWLETGMYAFPVAEALYAARQQVSVVNPARISAYARSLIARNKTDRFDAASIADFCRTQSLPEWHPPREELRELQALVRLLEDLTGTRQAESNRLKNGVRSAHVAHILQDHICYLDNQIKHIEQLIQLHVDLDDDLARKKQLLLSIPGIGEKTAHILLGEILYFDSFESAKQVAAFAGLNPKQRLSGKMKGRSAISKIGNAHLRKALYFPAIVARKHNPLIRDFCARMQENRLVSKEVVVAGMRKLLHISFGVLKNDCPFDPHYELRFIETSTFLPIPS